MLTIIFREMQIKTRTRGHLIPLRVATVLACYGCHERIPQAGRCNSRALFSHISGGWKSRGVGSFGFLQGLSLWLADGSLFAVSSPGLSPVCAHSWFLSGWPNPLFLFFFFQIPFSYEDTSQMGLRLTLMASFSFNYLLRPYLKIWLHLDMGLQHTKFEGA